MNIIAAASAETGLPAESLLLMTDFPPILRPEL